MKVALVVPGGVDRSGTHRVIPCILWLLRRIAAEHDLHVFAMRGEDEPCRYELLGACVHNVGGAASSRRTLRTLRSVVAEHRRAPFDVLHALWASGPGVVAALARRVLGVPVLLHVTGGDLTRLPAIGYGGRLTAAGRARTRLALAAADALTAPSGLVVEQAQALGFAARRVPLGVDRDAWPAADPPPRDPSGVARLIHVASLNRVKDQPTLLRALARLARAGESFALDVVGVDTLDGAVQRLAGELCVGDRVRFRGFLPQERLRPMVAAAHLMVVSSRHEADPVAMLEAAAAGVPTVGTAVGHVRDWAPCAAVAVPVGDDAALAREVAGLLADEPRRRRVALAARERALAEDADWSAARVLELYEGLARRPRAERVRGRPAPVNGWPRPRA